ncbi:MAG: DNA alkylation repair protein [Roseibium sp.]|nr:DNA alkylation repair protein [Roseibium sp.]
MEPFKNKISADLVQCLARHLERQLPAFDAASFKNGILADLDRLELKQRAERIARELHEVLPADRAQRSRILLALLAPGEEAGFDGESDQTGMRGWGVWPLTMVVGTHGLEDFDGSFALLKEMTKRSTAEFDVRPFLHKDQDRALDIMAFWVADPNVHVRRLVSEGTRPRLPWGMRLPQLVADPSPTLPLLEALRDDKEEYVRRSVANHLNDIAKDHPDLVADLAGNWLKGADHNRGRLVRHACRTLIKQGHPVALAAFGLNAPAVEVRDLAATPVVVFGDHVEFGLELVSTSRKSQDLVIDYLVHFKKANGSLAPKVFKWTRCRLGPGERLTLGRRHAIRPITTRKYYPGGQAISVRINGQDFGRAAFELEMMQAG